MKGLEISREFYFEYGKPLIEKQFPELTNLIAVGFVGSGSERYGFDDEFSRDHDFEAGFSIFLPDEKTLSRRHEFLLERAYSSLPKEFKGIKRQILSPVGGNRNGPIRTRDFYMGKTGSPDGNLSAVEWLTLPLYTLFEATDGEVFFDGLGEFTKIRNSLLDMPEDVRKKRIAGNLVLMAQSGQYNYNRCYIRGEKEGSAFALSEFVKSAVEVLFLLERKYTPYYKWSFHALKEFEDRKTVSTLSTLLLTGGKDENDYKIKTQAIEEICLFVANKLRAQNLTDKNGEDLEVLAYSVNGKIENPEIRNYDILISV